MGTLKGRESQYARSLIEASLDPLFTISPEGKITDINKASVDITEVTREDLIGTDFFEYFTEPEKARDVYKQVFSEGFVADFPLTIRDGKLSGDALTVLIDDILDLAKVDSGKMVFEQTPFRIAASISAMLHLSEPKIHEKERQKDTAFSG
ncbi:MAG: PAS domain-containing protein [Bacteroidales bacterium]|nr:PAS domain-containing protein [Bacteroidales bacterium]